MPANRVHTSHQVRTTVLYFLAIVREFRWTLIALIVVLLFGASLYLTSATDLEGRRRTLDVALYATWMAMLAQPVKSPPDAWYLRLLCGSYPLIGFILVGEGVVRLAMLMVSKRQGEKEWMKVMASTYRDHAVVCGVGRLGVRVIEQLMAAATPVVAIERHEDGRFLPQARKAGVPIIIGDMKDDQTLIAAGVPHAKVVIIATNDDIANLEVALDSRRLNPKIRVVMRLFEQSIAQKISNAFLVDVAFSDSMLAAPMVTAMSLGAKVTGSSVIAGIPHVTAELRVEEGSALVEKRIEEVERGYCCKVLARTGRNAPVQLPPAGNTVIGAEDVLVVHTPGSQLATLAGVARGKEVVGVG
jgi:voltage-gated potassium channel